MSNTSQASQRIASLLDENSFVEIGGLVTARATDFNMEPKDTPADGVITGYGLIDGNLVYVYSQDASVMNGSVGEMHANKIVGLYNMALKMGAPVIGLLDSAGLRLQEATDALNAFGKIYKRQALASGVIPQITAIFGNCGGGLAMFPTLTDFTFMEAKNAKLFVNAPNAIDGNEVSKCDSASAEFQSTAAGNVDVIGDEAAILGQIRQLVTMLPSNNEENGSFDECTDDLNRLCDDLANCVSDTTVALSRIADNQFFFEMKPEYAKDMVTGFIKLNGVTIGAVANNATELSPKGCFKAAEFVEFCDAFDIPVLSLTNVKGYEATMCSEKNIAKAVAKLTYAFANATVPKVNVIIGQAFGSAYVAMNSKAIGADMTFAWDTASIGMMDATFAAKIMYDGKGADVIDEKAKEYAELQASAVAAAKRGYVDQIIQAADTRKYVIGAFEMLFTKREDRPSKKHGTV
ncbi:MAG TPA: carboxyl transferase domain-containing protein [Lachnospiraceae bacterium]|nr:carboxyl transferase domain-containing protein [Lachnospiraceae bacterium]